MIYFIYGDPDKARKKAHDLIDSMQKKRADASLVRVDSDTWRPDMLDELLGGQGLFHSKLIIHVDKLLKNKEAKEVFVGSLKEIQESPNVFVFLEEDMDKATLGKFEKKAEKVQFFEPSEPKEREEGFKIFSLTEALGMRNKKQLWILYTEAKRHDVSDEEIHGILFWQVKAMLLAGKTPTAAEAGLNPFVYSKSKGFLKNFSEEELVRLSSDLVHIYHDSRRGKFELASALERLILQL